MTDDNLRDALQGMRQPEPGAVWIKDVLAYVEPELNRLNIYIENQREPWQAKLAKLEQENTRLREGLSQSALAPDPGNLPARMAEVIGSHEWTEFPRSAHNQHNYYAECAVCQRDIQRIAEVALGVRDELVAHLSARASAAEARVGHAGAGAQLSSERLAKVRQELAELKRVTDPPSDDEEMPTDPAELREMWEFVNRQARWQWHMAHKYGSQVERVRALHSPETDPRRTPDCKGCRTVATYTLHEDCKTIAALNAPQRSENTTTPARETV